MLKKKVYNDSVYVMKKIILARSLLGLCLLFGIAGYAFSTEDAELKLKSVGGKFIIQDKDAKTIAVFDAAGNFVTSGTATVAGSEFSVGGSTFIVKDGNVEKALRKFKKKIQESGLLDDLRSRETYEKPTTERKRKKGAAKARWRKQLRVNNFQKNYSKCL